MNIESLKEEVEIIELLNNWTLDSFIVNEWEKNKSNYCGIVEMDTDGTLKKRYCASSNDEDLFFNIKEVSEMDILMVGWCHRYKKRGDKKFYLVVNKTEDELTVIPNTTFLKAKKMRDKCNNE